jgi:hypothetical protein
MSSEAKAKTASNLRTFEYPVNEWFWVVTVLR